MIYFKLKKSNICLSYDDDEHIKQEGYLFGDLFELSGPIIFFNYLNLSFFGLQEFSRASIMQVHSESSSKRPAFRRVPSRLSSAFDQSKM